MAEKRKRVTLSLEDRVAVVKRSKAGETAISIANSLKVGKTQIQGIIKDKEAIEERWKQGERGDMKRKPRKCPYEEINKRAWDWFCEARRRSLPVSGRGIQDFALNEALKLAVENFSASNGWLESWQRRYNVSSVCLSGERGEVDVKTVEDWKKRVPDLCAGYDPKDIFNADETGLYYRAMPTRSMVVKGGDKAGVKIAKDRVTILLCASMAGEKIRPLVVGRCAKPRCFNRVDMMQLGIDYFFNRKAWMTGEIFTKWAQKVNNRMKILKRNILIFVDNCSAHPPLSLSNVTFKFLPPNTTSMLQPLDAGIIQAVKTTYRRELIRHLLIEMEKDKTSTGSQLAKTVDLLDAVLWLRKCWNLLAETTITRCFHRCGFQEHAEPEAEEVTGEDQPVERPPPGAQALLGDVTLAEYASMDNDIQTSLEDSVTVSVTGSQQASSSTSSDPISQAEGGPEEVKPEKEEEEPEGEELAVSIPTIEEAASYARLLTRYCLVNGLEQDAERFHTFQSVMETKALQEKCSQPQRTISSFFKPRPQPPQDK